MTTIIASASRGAAETASWSLVLRRKTLTVETVRRGAGYSAVLDRGGPEFLGALPAERRAEFSAALGLAESDLSSRYPPEVVSTGLRYLVVPIESGLEHTARPARVTALQCPCLQPGGTRWRAQRRHPRI